MSEHLHHKLAILQQHLMHGKLPRDLQWDDAVSLISHLGSVETSGGDDFTFVIGDTRALFKRTHSHHLDMDDVSRLRRLLQTSGTATPTSEKPQGNRMIVVVDHHVARIFEDLGGSRPQELEQIEPVDPHHFHHHLIHRKEAHYEGDRVPEDTVFYAAIVAALVPAKHIVLIGHGVGKSNAAAALMDYLQSKRPDIAKLVQAQEVADLSALTEPQIAELAQRHLHSNE